MNYDSILAIINCFKDKITFIEPTTSIKKEIPQEVKEWYLEWKKENQDNGVKDKTKYISSIKETFSKELCIYYMPPREVDSRIITETLPQDELFNKEIKKEREKLIKEAIYKYLETIFSGIEIMPYNIKKLEKSVYECKAKGNDKEQIKIDYDETKQTINLILRSKEKYLNISSLNYLESTRYDGMITIERPIIKRLWSIRNLFKKKSKLELINKEKADFISVTQDKLKSNLDASGTTYSPEGIYIYEIKNNKYSVNYYDQETINTILSTNLNKREELNDIVNSLTEKKELTNICFTEKLEEYGLLPSSNYTIEGISKELEILINKSYLDPKSLLQDLYKIN